MQVHSLQPPLSESHRLDSAPKVRCRLIGDADLEAIADLLTVGFPRRSRSYWERALALLSQRPVIENYPRYGYMLDCDGAAVGVILLLCSKARGSDEIRCNGSSWYVTPEFRHLSVLLVTRTLKLRATHTNLSPAANVVPIFEALGYKKFCNGLFAVTPSLAAPAGKTRIVRVRDAPNHENVAATDDLRFLRDHAHFGCVSLWCETPSGNFPFIFRRRFVDGLPGIPAAQLIYCDSMKQFVRFAGPIGRYLALRGMPFMIAPADGPIPGLVGKFFDNKPMYFRGAAPPPLGDLAYTEIALFGI
jgi:hypothetical protein